MLVLAPAEAVQVCGCVMLIERDYVPLLMPQKQSRISLVYIACTSLLQEILYNRYCVDAVGAVFVA